MKKLLIGFVILAAFLLAVFCLLKGMKHEQEAIQPLTTGAVVFDMTYRGLGAPADEPRYHISYGYSRSRENDNPFIKALKANVKNIQTVYNPDFKGAKLSAIELEGRNPVAFYFDLNADGKVSDNEKILPLPESKWTSKEYPEFITPDFMMNTRDGRQVPFRVLLRVDPSGRSVGRPSRPACSWSAHCVLEGTSVIDGKAATLILFADGSSGSFTKFGSCSYSLQIGEKKDQKTEGYTPHPPLSRIINHDGTFYDLKLIGTHEKGKTVQAVLEKYSGAISDIAVKVIGGKTLEVNLDLHSCIGREDQSVCFNISGTRFRLPAGSYEITRGHMSYGVEDENQWTVFIEDFKIKVAPEQVNNIELSKPVLSITAEDANKQAEDNPKNQSVFSKGTKIRLTCTIRGISGERYDRFNRSNQNTHRHERVDPRIRIVDSDGGEVTGGKAEYG